jgi:class 3 adenylate cyclase
MLRAVTVPSLLPTGTVTFLFTDLEGSTKLWQQSPDSMETALQRHDEIIRSCVAVRGGYIFATGGDGFSVAFASAGDAIAVAVESQRALVAETWPPGVELRVRMGVHTGVAQERDGNYFGSTLNRIGRLHAVAHGSQVIVSDATATLVKDEVDLRDLGRHRLRDFDESSIFQVLADGLPDNFPALRTLDTTAHNLPSALDEFVGRDGELRDLLELLRASRLVTLTGVGGTGKTRLALEAATHELGRFSDGVWVVELAALTEASATPFVIGEVVGAVQQDGLSMVESLARSLAVRQLLLVLDNCEHLLEEVAGLVGVLLARCPELVVLATSREGLAVRGERIVAVPSLQRDEAVALFTLRAASAGAEIGERDERDVAEIVDRLDGLPLAIELAAARARGLSIREIADRLDDRFRLLRGAGRGRLERHQTLWNTVAWSY